MFKKIRYYLWASYRRRLLDKLQNKYSFLYKGIVLDIGGRDRGMFKKPKDKVEKWIFADIESKHNPDIILDVADMNMFLNSSIDCISAMELFEHVEKIEKGWNKVFFMKDKETLPFEDEYFDFINCDQVIEHIYKKDIDFYLEEIKRVLKKDGIAFFVTPNYPIKRLYDFVSVLKNVNFKKIFDDPTHVNFYSFKSIKKEMNKFFYYIKLVPTGGLFFNLFKRNFFSHKIFIITKKNN